MMMTQVHFYRQASSWQTQQATDGAYLRTVSASHFLFYLLNSSKNMERTSEFSIIKAINAVEDCKKLLPYEILMIALVLVEIFYEKHLENRNNTFEMHKIYIL